MQTEATAIFEEYNKAKQYKEALGEKGLYEQGKINERFYSGNQWYGANCGNDRPLVRHNIIKRIGDCKIAQTLSHNYGVSFFAQGMPSVGDSVLSYKSIKEKVKSSGFGFKEKLSDQEVLAVTEALSQLYKTTSARVNFDALSPRLLREAYINGAGVLYTYFDGGIDAGIDLDGEKVKGDIRCEVLKIGDVYFGDPSETDIQSQPYIILAARKSRDELLRQAEINGTENTLINAEVDSDGKILVLTKLYKEYEKAGTSVKCVKVTNGGILKSPFDTKLHLYPLSVFRFGENETCAYGESEITYLIPNQIAINRMITASVWSNIAAGMPMMLINGDTVSGDISNDPGQIIKIYGTNEDVASAVKFVCPPDYSEGLNNAANNLIENTLTQSGTGPVMLGDEKAQNAAAITRLQTAALMPLNILKGRYKDFIHSTALIWADFWLNLYFKRRIRIEDEDGVWYFPFDAERYSDLSIAANVTISEIEEFSAQEKISALGTLYDKGIITKSQYLSRLPDALIDSKAELLTASKEEENETE